MTTRTLIIATLIFFSLAPAALAGSQANGTSCVLSSGSECQSGICKSTGLDPTKYCQPTPSTSPSVSNQVPGTPVQATCAYQGLCSSTGANGIQCPGGQACTNINPSTGCGTCPTINPITNPTVQTGITQPTIQTGLNQPPGTAVFLNNPLKSGTSLESFLQNILTYVIRIGTIIVILMIVFVGYKFVVAQGKPAEIEEAKKMLLWTVVGALILLGSQAIAISIKATVTSLGG